MSTKRDLDRDGASSEGGTPPSKRPTKNGEKSGEPPSVCVTCSKPANKDSIECEFCHEWEHYQCAGISKNAYKMLGNSGPNVMFFCTVCHPQLTLTLKFINQIEDKQKAMENKLQKLEDELKCISASNTQPSSIEQTDTFTGKSTTKQISPQGRTQHDRKFNVVVYGIKESNKGTPRHERTDHDLQSVAQIITKVDNNINPLSICDLVRLGKYQADSNRPRPLLVKFNRAIDVSVLLAKTSSLPKEIKIKPDMSPTERQTESILLKERWSLIQAGHERKNIKLRGSKIFVNNKLHGEVIDSSLVLSQTSSQQAQMDSNN